MPNSGHGIANYSDVLTSMNTFYMSILFNNQRPEVRWERINTATGGIIKLYTNAVPLEINSYYIDTFDDKRFK